MSLRSTILSAVSEPSRAYLMLLIGAALVARELAAPGYVLPGIVGAICIVLSLWVLAGWQWTWYGAVLIVCASAIVWSKARTGTWLWACLASILFAVGSTFLILPPDRIHPLATLAGVPFALGLSALIRVAVRASDNKRST